MAIVTVFLTCTVVTGKDYDIRDYGAVKDCDCSQAVRIAIEKCTAKGGGRVVVPAGRWFHRGPLLMKDNVELHVAEGGELVFSYDEKDYLPVVCTRWEGTECWNYSPLIYGCGLKNVSFTGKGIINGSGSKNFATWKSSQKKDQQEIRSMGRELIPVCERVFGEGHWLRPAMLELIGCENLKIENLTFVDAPFWVIHPIDCDNVTVRGITVNSCNLNNDGCDPESCRNVLIENCSFNTGDDGIAIKSGRDNDGWRMGKPTEKVVIRNCTFNSKANGICIGSEISGGVRDVYIENVRMSNVKNGIYFKSNLDRGGFIENVRVKGVKADTIRNSLILFDPDYKSESKGTYPTRFSDFCLEDIEADFVGNHAIDIAGFENMPIQNVSVTDLTVREALKPVVVRNADNVNLSYVTVNGQNFDRNVPDRTMSLNGEWYVAISDEMPEMYVSTVQVPGIITMARPSLGNDLHGNDPETEIGYNYVWYRHRFNLDMDVYPKALLRLRAKYNAKVYLNGKEIGYDHHCAYSHGVFDLSDVIRYNGENELVVRVGSWNTSSYPSKDNSAEWWRNSRAPGIWDDVTIEFGQNISVCDLAVLPDVGNGLVKCRMVLNNDTCDNDFFVTSRIMDGQKVIEKVEMPLSLFTKSAPVEFSLSGTGLTEWTAGKEGNPKLYTLLVSVRDVKGSLKTEKKTRFGYRQIKTEGKDVLLNGQKILFRAENVAFTRAVNRWAEGCYDEQWIRRFIRSAVHDYNLNYLRIHLGHAYSRWYDIADEEGMMLQDEWRFMHDAEPVRKELEETEIEFRRWVEQNINHPSIVAWDQENEGGVKLEALKAELRQKDPTRLWGEDDYIARHIYEYSENIVAGFDHYVISDQKPSTVLESCRLWTNEFGEFEKRENFKTSRTASGWNIYYCDTADAERLVADLHADIGTFYRSRRLQAWAPFALLSGCVNGHNFFKGDIVDSLVPQQNLLVLARLNEPVGASFEMLQCREWYKDMTVYAPKGTYKKKLWIWNDLPRDQLVSVKVLLADPAKKESVVEVGTFTLKGSEAIATEVGFTLPKKKGIYFLTPVIGLEDGRYVKGVTRRLMVAGDSSEVKEMAAFGGRKTYRKDAVSILENFTLEPIPVETQQRIIATLDGQLIDKIKVKGEGDGRTYTVQSTRYESNMKLHITTNVFDASGNIRNSDKAVAMPFISIAAPVRKTIVAETGAVPEDESRITCRDAEDGRRYDITMIGTKNKYVLVIKDDGTLVSKRIHNN